MKQLPTTCDICGGGNLVHKLHKDGKPFIVPQAWGRRVGIVFEPEGTEEVPLMDQVEPDRKQVIQIGETFYVFQADDGTIRIAKSGACSYR